MCDPVLLSEREGENFVDRMPPSKKRRTAEAKSDDKVKRTKEEEQKCIDCPLFDSDGQHDTPFNELPLHPESIVKHLIDEHGLTGSAHPHFVGAAVEGLTLVAGGGGSCWPICSSNSMARILSGPRVGQGASVSVCL